MIQTWVNPWFNLWWFFSEYLKLGDVLIEGNSDTDEDYEDTDSDRFLSEVLRHCSNLQSLDLSINDITDNSGKITCICTCT